MIAVAVLGAGALLVTLYATLPTKTDLARMTRPLATKADVAQLATRAEQRVRVDQQLPDRVGDVSETTAAVNRVNEELYRTNAELLLLIETVEATNIELVLVIETVEATNAELLRVIETLERTNGRLEQAVDTVTARLDGNGKQKRTPHHFARAFLRRRDGGRDGREVTGWRMDAAVAVDAKNAPTAPWTRRRRRAHSAHEPFRHRTRQGVANVDRARVLRVHAVTFPARCGSKQVPSRSMAQATLSRRSATERSERACPWPRLRSA